MRTPILSLAGATVLLFAGCQAHEPTHFELAEAAMAKGDKATALTEYQEAVRLEPVHKHAWRHIGYLKSEKQGCKEYEKEVRDALLTFLMLETYEIGDVAGDKEFGIPETPVEPHLARNMVRALNRVIHQIDSIEDDADVCYREFLLEPTDAELKSTAMDAQQACLDANLGVSPRAHWYMGEILRKSGDEAGANGHYQTSLSQSKDLGKISLRAQAGVAMTGGNLDEGWAAVAGLDRRDLYIDFIEACLKHGDPDHAIMAATHARKHFADLAIWRMLAEAHLLKDQTANAGPAIATLLKWPCDDKAVNVFLRLCLAAEMGEKTDEWTKKLAGLKNGGSYDVSRLVAHVDGSKADAAAKAAVKKAADKLMAK